MNENNLSPQEEQKLQALYKEEERLEDLKKEVDEKISKGRKEDQRTQKTQKEKELKELEEKKERAEENDKLVQERLKEVAGKPGGFQYQDISTRVTEVFKVSIPGGGFVKTSDGPVENLVWQMNIVFAKMDNPFSDFGSGLNDEQRQELTASIIYGDTSAANRAKIDIERDRKLDKANKDLDPNWEVKETFINEKKGITEPTLTSNPYLWLKRWWKFHKKFAESEYAYGGKRKDFIEEENGKEKFPVIQRFPVEEGYSAARNEYRDVIKLIKEKKMYEDKTWFEEKVIGSKFLLTHTYILDVPGGTEREDAPSDSFEADFLFFLETAFNSKTKNKNLLLTTNNNTLSGSSSPYDYRLSPKEYRDERDFSFFSLIIWQPKEGKESSTKFEDHETKAIKGVDNNTLDGWNYPELNDDPKYVHRFTNCKGFLGMLDIAENVFFEGNIAEDLYYKRNNVMSHPVHKAIRHKTYKIKNLIGSEFYEDIDELENQIRVKQNEIDELDTDYHENNLKVLEAQKRQYTQRILKIRKEIDAITGNNEKKMRDSLARQAKRIKEVIENNRKQQTSYFKLFEDNISRLNKVVRERLKDEPQNINSDKSKKLEEGTNEHDKFNIMKPDESDQYFKDDDETKKILDEEIRGAWKEYQEKIWLKIRDHTTKFAILLTNNGLTREKKTIRNLAKR